MATGNAVRFESAIGSHVGLVRSNNQDSGYAGHRLYFVADGMGGHAGGDVASAITTRDVAEIDTETFDSPNDAVDALADRLLHANEKLSETVRSRPELSGMGTTFCGVIAQDGKLGLAHIGDSRLYRLRDEQFTQITKDHTFVQRLVDSGKITEEEAATHPRRSVLMRVLGDVDSSPKIDTDVLSTKPGDLWLLCSDGLCGYVDDHVIQGELRPERTLQQNVDALIDAALQNGAPDNVTVVLVQTHAQTEADAADAAGIDGGIGADEGDSADENAEDTAANQNFSGEGPRFAGSAANEDSARVVTPTRTRRIGRKRPRKVKVQRLAETHFEPRVDEYLAELIAETKRRNMRRRALWALGALVVAALIAATVFIGYQWTQTRYYVGTDGETVIIYQGVQQNIGPIQLHSEAENTGIPLDSLDTFEQKQVNRTISTDSLKDARELVLRLGGQGGDSEQ